MTKPSSQSERQQAQANIAENRKAHHDYHLFDTFEAGIALLGTEVKAIREGRVNLRDSFARVDNGEVFLCNVNISPYSHRGYATHEPLRRRKLLLHRNEIRKLVGRTVERGMTLVPVRMYFKDGRVKVAVALLTSTGPSSTAGPDLRIKCDQMQPFSDGHEAECRRKPGPSQRVTSFPALGIGLFLMFEKLADMMSP